MLTKSVKSMRAWPVIVVCVAALASTTCGGGGGTNTLPTMPTPPAPTTPAPAPAPAPAAPATGSVQIAINPNPVPFSGQAITDTPSCTSSKNTWFYDQVFTETGGAAVTFNARVDKFDDSPVNSATGLNVSVPAKGSLTWHSRWCSATATAHTAQTTWNGVDANGHAVTAAGPVVRLMAK